MKRLAGYNAGWFFALLFAALICGAIYASLRQPSYQATAALLIDPQALAQGSASSQSASQLVTSQLDVITSQPVLDRVVTRLGLARDPDFTGKQPASASEKAALARQELRRRLTVDNDGRSSVIHVSAKASSASDAARLANAVAATYIDVEQQQQLDALQRRAQMLGGTLPELRQQALSAAGTAEGYRQRAGLIMLSSVPADGASGSNYAAATPASSEIMDLAFERGTLAGQAVEDRARFEAQQRAIAAGRGASTAEVLKSSVVRHLKDLKAQAVADEAELLRRYQPDHPKVRSAEAEVRTLQAHIDQEIARIHSSVGMKAAASARAVADGDAFNRKLEQARDRDLTNATRLKELQRDANMKRAAYEKAAMALEKTRQMAEVQAPAAVMISTASPPLRAAGPGKIALLAIAAMVGIMLGLLAQGGSRLVAIRRRTREEAFAA